MTAQEILIQPYKVMTAPSNLKVLVDIYKNECGKTVCVSCPGSLAEMINYLRNYLNMSDFELKGNGYYRLSKQSSKTINNNIISNELAIEFLRLNPDRIRLFSKYPKNWRTIVFPMPTKEMLDSMKMGELRGTYGGQVTADFGISKEDYIDKILAEYEPEGDNTTEETADE